MRKILLSGYLICFINQFAIGQIAPIAFLNNSSELSLANLPANIELNTYLDSIELATGLDLFSKVLDLEIDLKKLPKESFNNYYRSILKISETELYINYQIDFRDLKSEDLLIIIENNDTVFNSNLAQSNHLFKEKLKTYSEIILVDKEPFGNSSATLYNLSISPVSNTKKVDFGDSGPCQVNANCPEENIFPNENKSTVRILWRNGSTQGWCTGTLVNNTSYDKKQYLLTAEHCAILITFASEEDFGYWTFFFNYQSNDCETPNSDIGLGNPSLSGAKLIARSDDNGADQGSDFLLLEITDPIPDSYQPFYAGWNRSENAAESGVCYHHPSGDIKKVSTFNSPPSLGTWNEVPNTHWIMRWDATTNGHGTTEGGSSGSGLFDENGLLVGALTGGSSSCTNTNGFDYYGALSYSWMSNGSNSFNQLKPWLDPIGTNTLTLRGIAYNDSTPIVGIGNTNIRINPNPAVNGEINILGINDFTQTVHVEVFSLSGRLISQETLTPISGEYLTLKVHNYTSGIYIVAINQGNTYETFKVFL